MIKKEYLIGLLIGVAITLAAVIAPRYLNTTAEYKWIAKDRSFDSLQTIKFSNGAQLIYRDPAGGFGTRQILIRENNGLEKTYLQDDHVYLNAAFPSPENAQVAIVSNTCGGSACGFITTYMILPDKNGLKKYRISWQDTYQFIAELNKEGLVSAKASNVLLAVDDFGSNVMGPIEYLNEKGFILPSMKSQYKPLISEHPDKFFDDKAAREQLAKLLGLDRFRALRDNMQVASQSKLLDYRYLVLIGCMPHNCGDSYGAVVVDTTNDNLWWVSVVDGKQASGSNIELTKAQIPLYRALFEQIDLREGLQLTFTDNGRFVIGSRNGYPMKGLQ